MKKLLLIFLGALLSASGFAQTDVQIHRVIGVKSQPAHMLTTVESFNLDKWGSTYFFIDMNYDVGPNLHGVNNAYWEISRGIKFWKNPFELHFEYNGGFGEFEATPFNGAYQIQTAWLFGGQYTWSSKDFSKIFTLQLMYKLITKVHYPSFQVTGVWNLNFFNKKLTVSGFFDFWRQKQLLAGKDANSTFGNREYVFLSQPQFWYNFGKHLSAGSEIDIENNFIVKDLRVVPTLALKWTF